MILVYVYDGTFEGILTSVFDVYSRREEPDAILPEKGLQQDLLAEYYYVKTDPAKADRVYKSIAGKISENALKNVYHVFLSEDRHAGILIYRYLKLGWEIGRKVDDHLADDTVFRVMEINRKLELEVHRLMGFVRFRQLEGNVYYAAIKPDYNVTELLAPHFAERLPDQKWIIHDTRRGIAALYNMKEWIISEFALEKLPDSTGAEKDFSNLWRVFYKAVEIADRANPKLQRRLMPRRYWDYLTEKW